jgi:geranylgeranyl pyrophosphate synthase
VLAACEAVEGTLNHALRAACAVELVHVYSLVHDDLPCMDNDTLRHGKPTLHIAFGEAPAILAGDALQALAFEWLTLSPTQGGAPEALQAQWCRSLARAAGKMVSGQALDLAQTAPKPLGVLEDGKFCAGPPLSEADGSLGIEKIERESHPKVEFLQQKTSFIDRENFCTRVELSVEKSIKPSLKALETLHRLKTGALLQACIGMGAACGETGPEQTQALEKYGSALGLAFQVVDDILDGTATTQSLGKTAGKDAQQGKLTYLDCLGLPQAQAYAQELLTECLNALETAVLNPKGKQLLHHLAQMVVQRKH